MIEKSVLAVDNHPASRHYLANFLKAKEFNVLEASTGKEGLCSLTLHWLISPAPARKHTCPNVDVDEYLVKSPQAIPTLEEILNQRFRIEN